MTDQRPIDPSALRDGDVVRVEWDNEGSAIGHVRRFESGRLVLDVGTVWQLDIRESATITDILRPVLVKGDRVLARDEDGDEHEGTVVINYVAQRTGIAYSLIQIDGGEEVEIRAEGLTRLPVAPEPAPIEVGDWWADMPTQADVLAWVADRWPNRTAPIWRAGKLSEEAGEVMGAVIKVDEGRKSVEDIRMEAAQVVICAMGLAESVGFDLWQAVADEWKRSGPATLQIVHTPGVE